MPEYKTYFDHHAARPEVTRVGKKEIATFSLGSPEKDDKNEDSVVWMAWEDALLLAIADGVGGQAGGSGASMLTIQIVTDVFKNMDVEQISMDAFREGVLNVFERANREIQDIGIGSGTTLTIVTVEGKLARVFSVGDSSTLICGNKGKIRFINTPHSPTGYAIAAGVLDENDALHHAERHLLSNLVGSPDMHIDIGPTVKLSTRDRILIASDGLWDNMYQEEIIASVRKGSLRKAADAMQNTCRSRMVEKDENLPGHADDLSFLIARRV